MDELPELPRYRLDENEQIVIDDIIDKNKENQEEKLKNTIHFDRKLQKI